MRAEQCRNHRTPDTFRPIVQMVSVCRVGRTNQGGYLVFSLSRYAYHEAGHAIVGHIIGRCISEISILADTDRDYKGYCAFDVFHEDMQGFPQWRDGSKNPECTTIMYAGTIALRVLCEIRGWNYQHWRGIDHADFDAIYLCSLEMGLSDDELLAMEQRCQQQARDILTSHWNAVEALAAALLERGRLLGTEAHEMIRQTLGETSADWREANGRVLSKWE